MTKPITLAALLTLAFTVCATAQSIPTVPSGPYPEDGTFCGPFTLCTPAVTRDATL